MPWRRIVFTVLLVVALSVIEYLCAHYYVLQTYHHTNLAPVSMSAVAVCIGVQWLMFFLFVYPFLPCGCVECRRD